MFLPARTNAQEVRFVVDTGSDESVISRTFVPPKQIEPCDLKEICYVSHTVKVLGQAPVSLSLSDGRSSLELVYKFYVVEAKHSLVAMDFLTDFQCVLDLGERETITLSRTPCDPLAAYPSPRVDLQVSVGDGRASAMTALVDTGSTTIISVEKVKPNRVAKTFGQNGFQFYAVKDPVRLSLGHSWRPLKAVRACDYWLDLALGAKSLRRTVISVRDWSMTFRSAKGDVTLPFLRN